MDKERCCFYLFLLGGGHPLETLNFFTLGYSSKSSLQKELFPKYILDLFLLPWKVLEAAPFLVKFKSSVHAQLLKVVEAAQIKYTCIVAHLGRRSIELICLINRRETCKNISATSAPAPSHEIERTG